MASQYIDISGNASRFSGMVRQLVDEARNLQEDTTKVVRIAQQISPIGAEDWTSLAGLLGLTAEKAQTFYTLLINLQAVINKPNYDTFIDRLG